jgi:hypothetical protein
MKLLFIENRYKTFFYESLANNLERDGHTIYWIVQNHDFKVGVGQSNVIPYPKNGNQSIDTTFFKDILESDRQINFFYKKNKGYIPYYYTRIKKIIEEINPDFVFGESTAFHELLSIKICKEKNILYLNPSTCRYPTGRFSFYKYDTLIPYGGSNETLEEDTVLSIIDSISNRKVKPDYMSVKKKSVNHKIRDKFKLIKSYYKGEKYNTPSPLIKYNKDKEIKALIPKWNAISTNDIDSKKFAVLYPMQMQPEANLDVWGRKYRNQLDTLTQIHQQLKDNEVLYVKLNPKCKYELSENLIDFVNNSKNVIALHLNTKMETVFNDFDLIITVTGTIAIECILTNKPVITLIETLYNTNKNCKFITSMNELTSIIKNVKLNLFPKITLKEKVHFINLLTKTSFNGVVNDPLNDDNCIKLVNVNNIIKAFNLVFN